MNLSQEYEKDFYAWIFHNAEFLRQGRFAEIDINNIIEELESMGRREKRELINRFSVLLAHLLKWRFQLRRRGKSWKYTIKEQRRMIKRLLKESPSLKYELEAKIDEVYEDAIVIAANETKLEETIFPEHCPFNLEECLDDSFLPEAIGQVL